MFKSKEYCQSCGSVLTRENAGTNADLSRSHLYCKMCFRRGRYTEPDMTYHDMIKKCYNRLNVKDMPWWKRYAYLAGYPMFLRTLARWRSRVVS